MSISAIDDDEGAFSDGNDEEENFQNDDHDRMFGEEVESNANSANIQSTELSDGEARAAKATTFVAPVSVLPRKSFPTGVEPKTQIECCALELGSIQVGNDFRSKERLDAGISATTNREQKESSINFEAPGFSASRTGTDDSFVPELDWNDLWQQMSAQSQLQALPVSDSLSGQLKTSLDVDAAAFGTVVPSVGRTTDTAAESSQRPRLSQFQMVEAMKHLLRDLFSFLPSFSLLSKEHMEDLALSMVRNIADDDSKFISLRDRMLRYFYSVYNDICPKTLEDLITWLVQSVQPVVLIDGDGENGENSGENRDSPSSANSEKKKRKPYLCPYCKKPKVTYTPYGIKIPHGTCPKHQDTDTGKSDNDIDRILNDPPVTFSIKFPRAVRGLARTRVEERSISPSPSNSSTYRSKLNGMPQSQRQSRCVNSEDNEEEKTQSPMATMETGTGNERYQDVERHEI